MVLAALIGMLAALGGLTPGIALAEVGSQPIHHSADREVWDRKTNKIELIGNAVVRQPGETLTADYVILDQNLRTLDARGNCVYTTADALIYGEEMHFNLDTRTGSIVGGRVTNDKFTLAGERINKLGAGRFQTHWGEYSTCRDCTQSWTLLAEDVDLEFDGYAYLSNVTSKIKDAPAFWLPYLVVPVKTRRQTGLLFPRVGTSGEFGFMFVQPFFWATSRSVDMTLGLGTYSKRGFRAELEGRYALSGRSGGRGNFYYLHDTEEGWVGTGGSGNENNPRAVPDRWALDIAQTQELPWRIDQKLRVTEVSDNDYPRKFGDVGGQVEPVLTSSLSFSHANDDFSAYAAGSRVRNLLYEDTEDGLRAFDPNTVQVYPSVGLSTNDRPLFGSSVFAGLSMEGANFTRAAGPTSVDADPAVGEFLREAKRASITPRVYTAIRPFDTFSIVPSAQYRSYFYDFSNQVPDLYRSYLLLQVGASTQLERIYETGNEDYPKIKHLIRPELTFSLIPDATVRDDAAHPFNQQIAAMTLGSGRAGLHFDVQDIIPRDNSQSDLSYFVPLGKSLAYGFTTQVIQRVGSEKSDEPSYAKLIEWSAGQSINFREYDRFSLEERQPLSRIYSLLSINLYEKFRSDTTYFYYPYTPKPPHYLVTSASYVFDQATRQQILVYDRSIGFTYAYDKFTKDDPLAGTSNLRLWVNFSLSDYILPRLSGSYSWIGIPRWLDASGSLLFQSPSRCWQFRVGGSYLFGNRGIVVAWDLSLNLTGTGFGGVSEVASRAMTN
jgi:hypothetical protein